MGRPDRDPRPEIELILPRAAPAETTVIRTGGGGDGPSRRLIAAILAAVAVLLVAGLALGGGADEQTQGATTTTTRPTSTTHRPTTSSTTTTALPVGPMFDQSTGVLIVANSGVRWTVLDADTGAPHEVDLGTADSGYGGLGVAHGVVLVDPTREATYWDLRAAVPTGVSLGTADQVLASSDPGAVWLIDALGYTPPSEVGQPQSVQLIGLDGQARRQFYVPRGAYVGGISGETAITAVGGRVFAVDESGSRAFATGELVAVTNGGVLVRECDGRARCSTVLTDPVTGTRHATDLTASGVEGGATALPSAPDTVAFVTYGSTGDSQLWLLDRRGQTLARGPVPNQNGGVPAPLPGALGWLFVDGNRDLARISRSGPSVEVERLDVPTGLRPQVVLTTTG